MKKKPKPMLEWTQSYDNWPANQTQQTRNIIKDIDDMDKEAWLLAHEIIAYIKDKR